MECDLAEPESLASLGGSAPGVFDRNLSVLNLIAPSGRNNRYKTILLALSRHPFLGWALNLESDITWTAISKQPSEISHWSCPISV